MIARAAVTECFLYVIQLGKVTPSGVLRAQQAKQIKYRLPGKMSKTTIYSEEVKTTSKQS